MSSCSNDAGGVASAPESPTQPSAISETPDAADDTLTSDGTSADPTEQSISDTSSDADTPSTTTIVVPETGIPGLDSTDRFCAAWSRWAGSYQVVSVTAAFSDGPARDVAALEVVASTVVVDANADLLASWPEAISTERDLAADKYFGPFTRRLEVGLGAFQAAGADATILAATREAWLAALARRDPISPELSIDLPDATWSIVDAAAADLLTQLVPFGDDPSLVVVADTTAIDDYIAATCPDQGALAGGEISGG